MVQASPRIPGTRFGGQSHKIRVAAGKPLLRGIKNWWTAEAYPSPTVHKLKPEPQHCQVAEVGVVFGERVAIVFPYRTETQ